MATKKRYEDIALQRDVLVETTLYDDGREGKAYYILMKKNDKSGWVLRTDENGNVLDDSLYNGFEKVPTLQKPQRIPRNQIPRMVHKTI